ncbi:hypothetical protein HAX54_026176, partial [Datura stramonium]|nr:hypothetical protein [Datura stramonium]
MLHNQLWISFSRYRTAKAITALLTKALSLIRVDRLNCSVAIVEIRWCSHVSFPLSWVLLNFSTIGFIELCIIIIYSLSFSSSLFPLFTEPITSVIHPFAEHIAYFLLFAIPTLTTVFTGTASLTSLFGYITYIDVMNNMGHCNFEFIPKWIFFIVPPLKYLMYTPSFHSLHHTQFRTNYSLFMPIYDYLGPWTMTLWTMITNCIYGRTFILERNSLEKFNFNLGPYPRYNLQYLLKWQSKAINRFIEDAILQAEEKGAKVLSLGLLNQLGSCCCARNSIPKGTTEVLLRNLTKVAFSLASALSRDIKIATLYKSDYEKLKLATTSSRSNFVLSKRFDQKIWLVGDGLTEEEQMKAAKGTLFFPFSQLPPKRARRDCFYHYPPAMQAPPYLQNLHACE